MSDERIIRTGTGHQTVCTDEPGAGGACHDYSITSIPAAAFFSSAALFATVSFQNGPIQETGVNGCHNEDLLAIVIDRLRGFQSGMFGCRDNAIALTKLEEALMWLEKRTADRTSRGVEGTHER